MSTRYPHNEAAMKRMHESVPVPTQEEMDDIVANRGKPPVTAKPDKGKGRGKSKGKGKAKGKYKTRVSTAG